MIESEKRIIKMMRASHWEQAKGHLNAILEMYNSGIYGEEDRVKFHKFDALLNEFIKEVEEEELQL